MRLTIIFIPPYLHFAHVQAVILAAGRGSRLLPLTQDRPKPLIPFMNELVIDRIIQRFINAGVDRFMFLVDYKKEKLIQHLQRWKNRIEFEIRDNNLPFGTAGAVKRNMDRLDDIFFVSSSDLITEINLKEMIHFHHARGSKLTVAFSESDEVSHYGIATMDEHGKLTKFLEKPRETEAFSNIVNAGIYIVHREALAHVPPDCAFDFSRDLFPYLIGRNYPIYGYKFREYWNDIGRHSSYLFATHEAIRGKVTYSKNFIVKHHPKGVLYCTEDTSAGDVEFENFVVTGHNVVIENDCKLANTVLWDGVHIGASTRIDEAIIAENVVIGKNCKIMSGVVIGPNTVVGDNVTLGQNLKLWGNSNIPPGTVLVGE
jgi:mannose-1-phosphate guanylyltransferase